jgi:hypothetical protein
MTLVPLPYHHMGLVLGPNANLPFKSYLQIFEPIFKGLHTIWQKSWQQSISIKDFVREKKIRNRKKERAARNNFFNEHQTSRIFKNVDLLTGEPGGGPGGGHVPGTGTLHLVLNKNGCQDVCYFDKQKKTFYTINKD